MPVSSQPGGLVYSRRSIPVARLELEDETEFCEIKKKKQGFYKASIF